ncbi:MAG: hypothetical protein AAGI17_04475 [Planctomycetota bacterium]
MRLFIAFVLMLGATVAFAQEEDPGRPSRDPEAVIALSNRWPELPGRLARLLPSEPAGYFELGEEVAAEASDDSERDLARHLYVLAFELASEAEPPMRQLQSSAALAIADLAGVDRDRAWLRAIARSLTGASGRRDWSLASELERPSASVNAARVLGLLRAGDGRNVQRLLADRDVTDLLQRYSGLIYASGPTNLLPRLETEARQWPDRTCRGRRYITVRENDQTRVELCPVCGGSPGWAPDDELFMGTLRFEAELLRGVHRSWAAQLSVDRGAVLRDPEPRELARTLGFDTSRRFWTAAGWAEVAPPGR